MMYGTVARLHVTAGAEEEIQHIDPEWHDGETVAQYPPA
jgi:hypothetical protein